MMKTIKLELSVKLLLGAIALGLFLNAFKDFPPSAYAGSNEVHKIAICNPDGILCTEVFKEDGWDTNYLAIWNTR